MLGYLATNFAASLWDLAESFSFFGPHFVHLQKGEYLQF
jgi:hypothetical protein